MSVIPKKKYKETVMFKELVPTILVMNDAWYLPYVLSALRGRFKRYVIYDAGSEDQTLNVIDWFTETEKAEFFVRKAISLDASFKKMAQEDDDLEALRDNGIRFT